MLIRNIEGATRRLEEGRDKYLTLPIRDMVVQDPDGSTLRYMMSAWEPVPSELDALSKGGAVVCNMQTQDGERTACVMIPTQEQVLALMKGASLLLGVPGQNHPPIQMFVIDAETVKRANPDDIQDMAIMRVGDV